MRDLKVFKLLKYIMSDLCNTPELLPSYPGTRAWLRGPWSGTAPGTSHPSHCLCPPPSRSGDSKIV